MRVIQRHSKDLHLTEMKVTILICLVAVCRANFLDTVVNGVKDAAGTVAHGVKDAANTVAGGVKDAANTVGEALGPVGHTLEGTFGDVWNVAKDPLEQAGKEILIQAGTFALEQGITLALSALAAGKRELPSTDSLKMYLSNELTAEYNQWRQDTEQQILGSKDELLNHMASVTHIDSLPADIKDYVKDYTQSAIKDDVASFVNKQAEKAFETATDSLRERLQNRLLSAIESLKN